MWKLASETSGAESSLAAQAWNPSATHPNFPPSSQRSKPTWQSSSRACTRWNATGSWNRSLRFRRRLNEWRAGRDSRAAFGCEGHATPLVAALPLVTRSSLATPDPQVRERALLAIRSAARGCSRGRIPTRGRSMTYALAIGISRRRAACRGTQDGTQHRKRHPGGTGFQVGWMGF
jgi:hypothetical protein